MVNLRAHVLSEPKDDDKAVLVANLAPGIQVTFGPELSAPEEIEVLVAGRPSREQFEACPRLGSLVIPFAGIPPSTSELLREFPDLAIFNLHHNSPATTEMAIGLLLAAAKVILPMDRALREGRWSGRGKDNPAVLLTGKTALVLGFGSIGRRVAAALTALGMRVRATRRRSGGVETIGDVEVHPATDLDALLPGAAVLVICLPMTEETRGSIDARRLGLLPDGAVLVNVARGPIVDETALYEALRDGPLHSAGLDVWYRYPGADGDPNDTRPSTQPFHELENVVMSPHRGGWLHEIEAYRMRSLATLLNAIAAGDEPPHRVDPTRGY